jgi:1-phosphofructokinase family hexose kinase
LLIINPNPCFDRTLTLNKLERGAVMRADSAVVNAGGKGINVARVVRALGEKASLLLPVGNADAASFAKLLAAEGADFKSVEYPGIVRTATICLEQTSKAITIINERGSTITTADWNRFIETLASEINPNDFVVCMGSFPTGVNASDVATLVASVHNAGGYMLVDSSPEFLDYAITAGADVVSPNLDEAESLLHNKTADHYVGDHSNAKIRSEKAALELNQMGIPVAIVTAGEVGVAIAFSANVYFIETIPIHLVSAVGAGDSFVAGLILNAEDQGLNFTDIDWLTAVVYGMACAGASCEQVLAGGVDPKRVAELNLEILGKVASVKQ